MPAEARGQVLTRSRFTPHFWIAAALILVLDLWTKHYVFASVLQYDPTVVKTMEDLKRPSPSHVLWRSESGEVSIRLVSLLNPGMMWGAFQEHPNLLRVIRPLAVAVIFLLLASLPPGQTGSRIALGGILGGALGNIWDSFNLIGVRDFFQVDLGIPVFDPFPAFNVADSAICVGVAVLALGMKRAPKSEAGAAPAGVVPDR